LAKALLDQCDDPSELALIVRDDPATTIDDERLRKCDTLVVHRHLPGWHNVARGGLWVRRLSADVGFFQYFSPRSSPVPSVSHIHDVLFLTHPKFFTLRERAYLSPLVWNARVAAAIVTVSEAERQRILEIGVAGPDRTFVVHNGVEPTFRPLGSWPRDDAAMVRTRARLPTEFVLYCGRINARKNIATLMRAMLILGSQAPPLVIVGKADWRQEGLDGLRSSLTRAGRLVELGSLADDDLAATYAQATVFCFPSRQEAFGLPNLEAMASGTPVVTSDIPAHKEVCGEAVLLVDPDDAEGLATAIENLLHDQALRAQKRRAGLERAAGFTWASAARQLSNLLEAVSG
jgi:glycosyltransferase involved in cell wall biosynthesis